MSARPSFEEALDGVSGVKGWMTDGQARRLWDCAGRLGCDQRIVEIGSFQGRSTIVLASSAAPGVEIVAIDPHAGNDRGPQEIEGFEAASQEDHVAFIQNLENAEVRDRVRHVRKPSEGALHDVEGPIDLLYIDGAHRYGPARDDIVSWGRRVKSGGTLLIHDSFNAIGVTLAQATELAASAQFEYVGRDGSLAEYRRRDLSTGGRVANVVRHVCEIPYTLRNQIVKVMILVGLRRATRLLGNPSGEWPY